MKRQQGRWGLLALAVLVLVPSCGDDSTSGTSDRIEGTLTVFAASSLTDAFEDLAERFEALHPDVDVVLNIGGSSALARQLTEGASADVFASADEASLAVVIDAGLASSSRTIARNRLEIIVESGNPQAISKLADLARPGLLVVLCAPEVPCGRYAAAALDRAGVTLSPASLEENVRAVVAKVVLGEADAGIVYQTDVLAAGDDADGVALDTALADDPALEAVYPMAVLDGAGNPVAAEAWRAFVLDADAQVVLRRHGFLAP